MRREVNSSMRILFFGSGAFGVPTLQSLSRQHEIVGVVTQPDRPAGRGGKLTPTPIARWAAEHLPAIPLFKPEKVSKPDVTSELRELAGPGRADAWVVIAFGQKLPKALLEGVFAINLHASLLPRWRGAAPINAAILAGDRETGNSVITLADRMDAGLVLGQSRRDIDPGMTAGELHDLLAHDGPALVERVLHEHASGSTKAQTQDDLLVTIATKLSKDSGHIDFRQPAGFLRRQVHAMTPWPGAAVVFQGSPLKLLRVEEVPADPPPAQDQDILPGTVVDPAAGLVACGHETMLRLLEVQPAGKRPMSWADFARGRRIERGDTMTPVGG